MVIRGGIIITVVLFLFKKNVVEAVDTTDETGCFTGEARDYMNTKSTTESGLECQRWDRQKPHEHEYKDEQFPDGSKCKAKNYCRDPSNEGFLWCYTMDPNKRWESCGIPWCNEPARNNNTHDCYIITEQDRESGMSQKDICESGNKTKVCKGNQDTPPGCDDCDGCCQTKECSPYIDNIGGYFGTWHRGESGRQCQRWDSQTPHKHGNNDNWKFPEDASVTAAQNYCRDPDNTGYLWCYTMDPNKRWESCGIPWCNEPARNNNMHDCYIITEQDRESGMSQKDICESGNKTKVCKGSQDTPPGCDDCEGCCQTKECSPDMYYIQGYNGTWHRGESGRQCQRWDSQTPHKHGNNDKWKFPEDASVTAAQNYCRDPDYTGFLWCYTMDPNSRWETCGIPFC